MLVVEVVLLTMVEQLAQAVRVEVAQEVMVLQIMLLLEPLTLVGVGVEIVERTLPDPVKQAAPVS